MKNIVVDFEKKVITVTNNFAKRAGVAGTPEYHTLVGVMRDFPDYTLRVKRTPSHHTSSLYNKLTYEYMEYYISTHDNAEDRMAEYKEMRLNLECHSMYYAHIKKWFLSVYPQIDDFTPEDFQRKRAA